MKKFIWSDEYSLGIGVIDEQHHHFFEIANEINNLLEKKEENREVLVQIINELTSYAFYHLATEEKYFNQFAYSDMANHMKAHTMFRVKVQDYSERIKNEKEDLPKLANEITDFAIGWLKIHIMVADKLYAPFFKEHGIK